MARILAAAPSDAECAEGALPQRVLDLGCGTGLATRAWLDQLEQQQRPLPDQLLLVDQAPAMVERAVALLGQRHPAVQGATLDAFDPKGFDGVMAQWPLEGSRLLLSSYALQWSADPLAVLQSVWAPLLRTGDWLAVALPDAGSFQVLRQALAAAALPSHLLELPETQALIGPAAQAALAPQFHWEAAGCFANGVPVTSALAYLRHFALIGARPPQSRYARKDLLRLCRCMEQQLLEQQLDYHSTWMLLRRR